MALRFAFTKRRRWMYTHVLFRLEWIRRTGVQHYVMAKLVGRLGPFSSEWAAMEALANRKLGLSEVDLLKYMTRMRRIRSGPLKGATEEVIVAVLARRHPCQGHLFAQMRARPGRISAVYSAGVNSATLTTTIASAQRTARAAAAATVTGQGRGSRPCAAPFSA